MIFFLMGREEHYTSNPPRRIFMLSRLNIHPKTTEKFDAESSRYSLFSWYQKSIACNIWHTASKRLRPALLGFDLFAKLASSPPCSNRSLTLINYMLSIFKISLKLCFPVRLLDSYVLLSVENSSFPSTARHVS